MIRNKNTKGLVLSFLGDHHSHCSKHFCYQSSLLKSTVPTTFLLLCHRQKILRKSENITLPSQTSGKLEFNFCAPAAAVGSSYLCCARQQWTVASLRQTQNCCEMLISSRDVCCIRPKAELKTKLNSSVTFVFPFLLFALS